MSLDVMLRGKTTTVPCRCACCDNEHTREETEEFYSANITHNLGTMAEEAGIYKHLWRPHEIGIEKAAQLIEPLRDALAWMRADRLRFEKFNSPNGWGLYENFIPWIQKYLDACVEHPEARVEAHR